MKKIWTENNMGDIHGKTIIVTGSNTGIGYETARLLANHGAEVIMACRNLDKADAAAEKINAANPSGHAEKMKLDLSDLESVEHFANEFMASHSALDMLIMNAGVMVPPYSKTAQGFELQFGTNHLGHFALCGHLLPALKKAEKARVVAVSSSAHWFGKIHMEDLQWEKGYKRWPAYGQSKLANMLFYRELQRRFDEAGIDIRCTGAHPGWSATELQRHDGVSNTLNRFFAQSPLMGAMPTLMAACDDNIRGGEFCGPGHCTQMRGYPKVVWSTKSSKDMDMALKLWDISENLTGVRYQI